MKPTLRVLFISFFAFILGACGGSGSSSSGGGGSFAGSYTGIATITITGGGASTTITGSLDIVIRPDGSVVTDPGTDFSGFGSVSGSTVIVNISASAFNEPGLSCLGSFRIEGTVAGNRITGTISGSSITCNGIPFIVSGTFNVVRVGSSRAVLDGRAMSVIGSTLRQRTR